MSDEKKPKLDVKMHRILTAQACAFNFDVNVIQEDFHKIGLPASAARFYGLAIDLTSHRNSVILLSHQLQEISDRCRNLEAELKASMDEEMKWRVEVEGLRRDVANLQVLNTQLKKDLASKVKTKKATR